MIHLGSCFLASYPTHEHLHVIVSNVTETTVTAVFVSSIKEGKEYDPACVLHKGDHPFIVHDSYIVYDKFIHFRKEDLEWQLKMGEYTTEPDVSTSLLDRIRTGAKQSEYLSKSDKEIFFK